MKGEYSQPVERLLHYMGRRRLAEYGRYGVHPDIERREGQRWLHGKIAAAAFAGVSLGCAILMAHELSSAWDQSQTMYAQIHEQRQGAVSECIKFVIDNAARAAPEQSADPLADCQRQIAAEEAYIHQVTFLAALRQ